MAGSALVVSDVEVDGEYAFERRQFGSNPAAWGWPSAVLLWSRMEGGCGQPPTADEAQPFISLCRSSPRTRHLWWFKVFRSSSEYSSLIRLAEVPGLGVDSAQQIIAEVGPTAATFPSAGNLSSWVGACPGDDESAGVSHSHRSPKGNRQMRRLLNQAANAAVKYKGGIFEILYRRYVPRLGHKQTIGVIAHRLCRLIWKILYQGVRYEERGPDVRKKSQRYRATRMIRELQSIGYRVELANSQSAVPA